MERGDPPAEEAALFPGQGVVPRREAVAGARPDLLAAVDRLLGRDVFANADRSTADAQPAIYCASLALWSGAEIAPRLFAGHSLGELTALAASGWLDELDGLRLVTRRGELMEAACARVRGGMVALVGTSIGQASALAERLGLAIAADNAPGQVVLSGAESALSRLEHEIAGRRIASVRLPVAGAFHSPLMEPVVEPFRAAVAEVLFTPRDAHVLSASTLGGFAQLPDELAGALTRPVRWRESLETLRRLGARSFAAVGPGRAIGGTVRRTIPRATVHELLG